MPLTSHAALYSDTDPNGPTTGRVLPEGDPDARFLLCGAGGLITDELAHRFHLEAHDSTAPLDEASERTRLAALNLQTYADNARLIGGPTHKALPGVELLETTPPSPK